MLPRLLILLPLCLLLNACHNLSPWLPTGISVPSGDINPVIQAKQRLQTATPCCSSFADFSYQTPLPSYPQEFTLGSSSPVAILNGVKSYFLAFYLPRHAKFPYRIAVKSELIGRWVHTSYLFAPTFVLLDATFHPIGAQDLRLCEYLGWSSGSTGAFGEATIHDTKARYLVVYSSAKQQASTTYWEQPLALYSADPPLQMDSPEHFAVPHGPDGTLWIGKINKNYRRAINNAVCGQADNQSNSQ